MGRISLDPPPSLTYRIGSWYSRRRYGKTLEPGAAMAHHPRLLRGYVRWELAVERWHSVPSGLKDLGVMAAATRVGCEWCMDFGYWSAYAEGLPEAKLRELPRWRSSDVYTPLERRVIAYAEAMSATPPEVTDEMVDELRADLTEQQLVELTMAIAVENQRARFNNALGLASQGFKAECAVRA